jgi:hypothetical protein
MIPHGSSEMIAARAMYVSVHKYRIERGTPVDAALEGQHFAATVAAIPGFRAYYLLEGGDAQIAAIGIFDTHDGIDEYDRSAENFATEGMDGLVSPVEVTEGQVLASRWDPGPSPASLGVSK